MLFLPNHSPSTPPTRQVGIVAKVWRLAKKLKILIEVLRAFQSNQHLFKKYLGAFWKKINWSSTYHRIMVTTKMLGSKSVFNSDYLHIFRSKKCTEKPQKDTNSLQKHWYPLQSWSDKAFMGSLVNQTCHHVNVRSLEITF